MTNQFLENERIALEEKITEARDKGNENTYKNLIQAYERVLELIRKENKWEDMYSHYYKGDKKINGENEYVATWKQNYAGDIKDHKVYKIEKEIKKDTFLNDDTLDKIEDIIGYKVFARKYGHTDNIGNVFNDISGAWNSISQDQQVEIIKLLNKQ